MGEKIQKIPFNFQSRRVTVFSRWLQVKTQLPTWVKVGLSPAPKGIFRPRLQIQRIFLFSNLLWYIKMESFEYQLTLRLVTRRTTLFLHTPLFFFFRFTVRSKLLDFKVLFDMYFLYRQSPNGWPQRLLLMKGSREQWIYKPHFIKIRSHFMDSIMHKGASVPWWVFVPHRYTTRGHQRDVLRCASKCCAAT